MHLQDLLKLKLVGADQALQIPASVCLVLAEFIFTIFSIFVVLSEHPHAILFLNILPH